MNNKFKIGDKVRRTISSFAGMKVGDIGTVSEIVHSNGVKLKEFENTTDVIHAIDNLELVKEINQYKVGQWYKLEAKHLKKPWYIKYELEDNYNYIVQYHINSDREYGTGGSFSKELGYKLTEIDLQEIQEYLPDNHEDKIKKMKNFKNNLAVKGSKSLLKAFEEELINLGYDSDVSWNDNYRDGSTINHILTNINKYEYHAHGYGYSNFISVNLPQDWDKALKLASEIIEEPKFKKGDWVYNTELNNTEYIGKVDYIDNQYIYINEYYQIRYINKYYQVSSILNDSGKKSKVSIKPYRLATNEEVERILLKVAEIKYPIGTRYIPFNLNFMLDKPKIVKVTCSDYRIGRPVYKDKLEIWVTSEKWGGILYENGKWAKIVVDPRPKARLFGHDLYYYTNNKEFKIGCQYISLDNVVKLNDIFESDKRISSFIVNVEDKPYTITSEIVKELLIFSREISEYEERN